VEEDATVLTLRWHTFVLFLCVPALLVTAAPAETYTGSLSTGDGGLLGTGAWGTGPSSLSWTIQVVDGPIWQYCYTLEVPERGISHFILELSDDFGWEKMESPQLWVNGEEVPWSEVAKELGWYGPSDAGNPSIPDDMYGIKVDVPQAGDGEVLTLDFCFLTVRDPVWGDFYSKDGADPGGGDTLALWNSGFGNPDTDPDDLPADGALEGHLLVPDTTEIPEPATLAVLAAGGMFALLRRRRR
jgi:hypothetical protein